MAYFGTIRVNGDDVRLPYRLTGKRVTAKPSTRGRVDLTRFVIGLLLWGSSTVLPASATVTFLGDWADFGSQFQEVGPQTRRLDGVPVEWVAGYGANQWRIVQERGKDRLQVERDPKSPKGGAVLRVEVRPGDTVGWTGERSEVAHMLGPTAVRYPVTAESGHEVYGISIKLDPNWQPPLHDHAHGGWQWGTFMQLHPPDVSGGPPAFALAVEDQFHVNTLAGDLIDANGQRRNATSLPFSKGELRLGHWVQFMIDVVWAYDTHGSLTIYRRDEGESSFAPVLTQSAVPTLQFNSKFPDSQITPPSPNGPINGHYWKAGYYRSVSPGVTSILWLGPIVRGTSLREVAIAAFGRP
jgi:Polysaccharide lyase